MSYGAQQEGRGQLEFGTAARRQRGARARRRWVHGVAAGAALCVGLTAAAKPIGGEQPPSGSGESVDAPYGELVIDFRSPAQTESSSRFRVHAPPVDPEESEAAHDDAESGGTTDGIGDDDGPTEGGE